MRKGAAAVLLLAAGCGAPAPPPAPPAPPVTLSTQNPGANVAPIVTFFRRACLENWSDNRAFAAVVASSGWPLRQVHVQNEEGPSLWRFDQGELTQWRLRQTAMCFLTLQSTVAPTPAALRAALRPFAQPPEFADISDRETESRWARPAGAGYRMVLTIAGVPASEGRSYGAGRQAVTIGFTRERIPVPGEDRE